MTDNLQPDQCGPISTRVVLAGGTLAFFDIPANPTLGTLPVNAAYFSPDGFNLEGNGGSTVAAYSGSLKIKAVVPVNGGVDTLFENGAVYFSPNGQNLGGACANGVCTIAAYGGPAPVTSIVPVSGGVDVVFAMSGGVENAYFSPDGVHLSAGGATVPIYQGGVAIDQIVPVGGSVVAIFENGAAYYSPDNRNLGGGGNTVSAYIGSVPIARIVKVGSGVLTQFQNDAVYLSPGGQNLGGGGSTIAIANWVHAADAPFPVRDSGKGAVFQGKLYLSGGFHPESDALLDFWSTRSDASGTAWGGAPVVDCLNDMPSTLLGSAGCWDAFSELEVWRSALWAIGSSVWRSSDGIHWSEQAAAGGNATPTLAPPDENEHGAVLDPYVYWISLDSDPTDVQRTSNPNGTPWTDLKQIQTAGNPATVMTPRCGAAVFVLRGRIWVEGGRDGSKVWTTPGSDAITSLACDSSPDYTNDVWSTPDGITWTQSLDAPPWAPRQWPCVATDDTNGVAWLAGGYVADFASKSSGDIRYESNLADVWYTKDGITWKQLKADTGSELPDDLASGLEPRHAPTCYVDTVNNTLVVVAGKVTRQPTPNPPYPPNVAPVPNHDSGDVSSDVRILQLPDPSTLP